MINLCEQELTFCDEAGTRKAGADLGFCQSEPFGQLPSPLES